MRVLVLLVQGERRRQVYAPWADDLPIARLAWALHLAFEYGGAVEVVRL